MHDPFMLSGQTLDGKYRLDAVLGEGGFGVVYGGRQIALDQPVAIKVLKPSPNGADTASFLREARVLFQLSHPGIVRLYDVGEARTPFGVTPYVVLEQLVGRSLEDEIAARARERRPFAEHELVALADGLLDALSFAHRHGVVHRDIKPANVMIVGGPLGPTPKILDFGLARGGPLAATTSGAVGLTPRYAAPEQWNASYGAIGPPTDLFALGLVLEEAATLAPALDGQSIPEVVAATTSPIRRSRVAERRPDLGPAFGELVDRATRVSPSERFVSADAMRDHVRTLASRPSRPSASAPYASAPPSPLATSAPGPMSPVPPRSAAPVSPYGAPATGPAIPLGRPPPLTAPPGGPPPFPSPSQLATVPPFPPAPPGPPPLSVTTAGPAALDAARGKGTNGSIIGGVLAVLLVAGFFIALLVVGVAYGIFRYLGRASDDPAPAPAATTAPPRARVEPSASASEPDPLPTEPSVPSKRAAVPTPTIAPSNGPGPAPQPSPAPSTPKAASAYGWRVVGYEGVAEADKPQVKAAVDQIASRISHCFEGGGRTGLPWNVTFTKPLAKSGRGFGSGVTRLHGQVHAYDEPGAASDLRNCTDNAIAMAPFPAVPYVKGDGGAEVPAKVMFFVGRP